MREPQQQTLLDEEATLVVSGEETTLVAPRFDDEETLVARPVVPFEGGADLPAPEHTAARPAPVYRSPFAPRRSGMLALALACVLVGGVLGGAGLYLYQRQSEDPAATTAQPPAAPSDSAQAPAAEGQNTSTQPEQPAQQTEAPAAAQTNAGEPARPALDEEAPAAPPARAHESVPAAERRTAPTEGGEAGTPKRGKKGDRDEETERRPAPQPDGNVARADQPEARRVDSIFYRQRRATRRARRDDDVDRLRRIFEGTP
jgi:type IV secretory pathway VirB10-like protein